MERSYSGPKCGGIRAALPVSPIWIWDLEYAQYTSCSTINNIPVFCKDEIDYLVFRFEAINDLLKGKINDFKGCIFVLHDMDDK